jgi:hypothetical protein
VARIVATQGAIAACSPRHMAQCLGRHMRGDWGCIDTEDREANSAAILSGERILSAYPIDLAKPCEGFGANTLWIIDRGPQRGKITSAKSGVDLLELLVFRASLSV